MARSKTWFFSHAEPSGGLGGLPHIPCAHKHRSLTEAARCARNRRGTKGTHVREVYDGAAVKDYVVNEDGTATEVPPRVNLVRHIRDKIRQDPDRYANDAVMCALADRLVGRLSGNPWRGGER